MPKWTGTWEHGRTYLKDDGTTAYVIRKTIQGTPYEITIDMDEKDPDRALAQAKIEFGIFKRDPGAYRDARRGARQVVKPHRLTPESLKEFKEYKNQVEHEAQKLARERYVKNLETYLLDWMEVLNGRDLRTIKTAEYREMVGDLVKKTGGAEKWYIASIRSFTKWLHKKKNFDRAQDGTQGLEVPQYRPEKDRLRKLGKSKTYPIKLIEKVYAALDPEPTTRAGWTEDDIDMQSVRDVLRFHAMTGLHYDELDRIVRGHLELDILEDQGEIAAVVRYPHKRQDVHPKSIDAETLAALRRLMKRPVTRRIKRADGTYEIKREVGSVPAKSHIHEILVKVLEKLKADDPTIKTERITLGPFRHCFATWSAGKGGRVVEPKEMGVSPALIAASMNHAEGSKMTLGVYIEGYVPPMIVPPIKLYHPDDPVSINAAGKRKSS